MRCASSIGRQAELKRSLSKASCCARSSARLSSRQRRRETVDGVLRSVDPGIVIRPETPADIAAIRDVTDRAFAGHPYSEGTEATIVDALRSQHGLAISLVAERDGRILGHVAFSPASAADRSPGWYALGPLSVEPRVQGQGIGAGS